MERHRSLPHELVPSRHDVLVAVLLPHDALIGLAPGELPGRLDAHIVAPERARVGAKVTSLTHDRDERKPWPGAVRREHAGTIRDEQIGLGGLEWSQRARDARHQAM